MVTYNGLTNHPTEVGDYSVTGTVVDAFYSGSATGTLVVAKGNQTISFAPIPTQGSTTQFTLTASASSGLPVSFDAISGPVIISGGSHVSFTGSGLVSIIATQPGNANWNPAPTVTNTFVVEDDLYYLTISAGPGGSVNVASGFQPAFSTVVLTATPAPYHTFTGWSGDILPGEEFNNPLSVYMGEAKSISAAFAEATTSGGVSIPWLVAKGITNDFENAVTQDPDDDGVTTGDEYFADTDPFDIDSYLSVDVIGRSGGGTNTVTLGATVSTNRIYDVEYAVGGADSVWQPVNGYTNILPEQSFLTVSNLSASDPSIMFRLQVRKP